ncbi:hypothetical protein M2175_004331 [Bradyrhizobium elkanii]|nr:hypothetical protein [Bradyrhizobium elkanii]MCS3969856.1 hypothetical protein [Bradyrhizobium japonicum]
MIVVAAFEAPAVIAGFDDVTVMGQPIEQRGGHFGVAEHARPFAEGEIGGHDDGGALIEPADEVEEKLATGLGEGQIAEFIQHNEVHPGQMLGEPSLPSVAGLGLEAIDEVDYVEEAAAGTGSDAASGDGNGQVGFACAGAANQHDVALLGDEAAASKIIDESLMRKRRQSPSMVLSSVRQGVSSRYPELGLCPVQANDGAAGLGPQFYRHKKREWAGAHGDFVLSGHPAHLRAFPLGTSRS